MAVPIKQSIPITFTGGLDTKTDPKQIAPTDFLELNNMVFSKGGSLVKRNGFETLGKTISVPKISISWSAFNQSGAGTLSNVKKLFAYNDELLINDAWNLFSYDANEDKWNYKGRSTMVQLSTSSILQNSDTHSMANEAITYDKKVRIIAFSKQSGFYPAFTYETFYTIQDIETGQIILSKALFGANFIRPSVISFKDPLSTNAITYVIAQDVTSKALYYVKIINQEVQGFGIPTQFYTNINAAIGKYDIHVDAAGNILVAAGSNTSFVSLSTLDYQLNTTGTYTDGVEQVKEAISWFDNGNNIWVVWSNLILGTITVKALIIDRVTLTVVSGPYIISSFVPLFETLNNLTGVWSTSNNCAFIFWDKLQLDTNGATVLSATYYANITNAGAMGIHDELLMSNVNISGRAFALDGIPHLLAHYSNTAFIQNGPTDFAYASIQPTDYLLNIYNVTDEMGVGINDSVPANIAAKISADQANPFAPFQCFLVDPVVKASKVIEMSLLKNSNYGIENAIQAPIYSPTGIITASLDFNLSNPDVQVLGNNAMIASGTLLMYDGVTVCEQNFHVYPNPPTYTLNNAGGGMGLTSGTSLYSYILVYEWIDNAGQVHRSFPSPVLSAYAGVNAYSFAAGITTGKITLLLPTLSVTNKPGTKIVINVYRTQANQNIYYLVGKTYYSTSTYGTVKNDPYVNLITFNDVFSDLDIEQNVQIYTTGALGYYAVPAPKSLSNFKSRAIAIAAEEKATFLYSNQVLPNFPVQFVPEFVQNVNTVGGSIVAINYLDDKMIIFKDGKVPGPSILFMVGQGPAPSGANNDYGDPFPISIDVGCVDRGSITQSPVGLIFKSNKGIFLLDRSLQTTYIGAAVEKYNGNTVISGQLIPNTTQVRFILDDGTMLMFDYFYKRWATFTTPAAVSDCIWQGEHTFVTADGQVYKEKPNTFADGTTPVYMSFKTAWIKLANLQNYQRAYFYYLLGECQSSTELECSTYFDFATSPAQTNVITPIVGELLTWRIFLANQRCQAFQISLQEKNGTTGEGFNLSGLNLVAGLKNSFIPQPNAYTVG